MSVSANGRLSNGCYRRGSRANPTNDKDFDGPDPPNDPCFGKPRKRKLEEQDSDKPGPTVFDMLNADSGVSSGWH